MNRRRFLKTLGGTGIVFAAAAGGLSQCDQMPKEAVQAWRGPDANLVDREWILSHALLAPNPHNMQSWIADLREDNVITLLADNSRLLKDTDPYSRQITIGQGTFLELLSIAAKEKGYEPSITLYPEGSPEETVFEIGKWPIARIELIPSAAVQKDPLFQQIRNRRSNKEPYEAHALGPEHLKELQSHKKFADQSLGFATAKQDVSYFRNLAKDAMILEMKTPRTYKESIDRTRIGADEILEHRDGIDLNGPFFWWLKTLGLMTAEKAMTPGTMAYQGGIDYALGWAKNTYSMGWLITENNSRHTQVNAGRTYVRLNLLATQLGVSMHPVSQILQEYPEMNSLQDQFNKRLGLKGEQRVQMFFRIGYQKRPAPSPRRNLADIVRT